jgi:hypothetical protein
LLYRHCDLMTLFYIAHIEYHLKPSPFPSVRSV